MASKRCVTSLTRQLSSSLLTSSSPIHHLQPLKSLISLHSLNINLHSIQFRPFSSRIPSNPNFTPNRIDIDADDNVDAEGDNEDEKDYSSAEEEDETDGNVGKMSVNEPSSFDERSYNVEEKISEAAEIGYKVVGPLRPDDRVFKHYEPAFAVVQVGSHQFKVSNVDCIYVEKLKYCEVNDQLVLNKVMMVGSPTQTIIGRPILPEAAVHAIVEEHALDAKVIIFKKKRRKNYRSTKGHRQELTRLRITDIQGIKKSEAPFLGKAVKTSIKKVEKEAVPA